MISKYLTLPAVSDTVADLVPVKVEHAGAWIEERLPMVWEELRKAENIQRSRVEVRVCPSV